MLVLVSGTWVARPGGGLGGVPRYMGGEWGPLVGGGLGWGRGVAGWVMGAHGRGCSQIHTRTYEVFSNVFTYNSKTTRF